MLTEPKTKKFYHINKKKIDNWNVLLWFINLPKSFKYYLDNWNKLKTTFIFTTIFDFSNYVSHNMIQDISILLQPNILDKLIISNILCYVVSNLYILYIYYIYHIYILYILYIHIYMYIYVIWLCSIMSAWDGQC